MLHALYFTKKDGNCKWSVNYNNSYVETETFKQEKQKNKPSFIPIIEGDTLAVISAAVFNFVSYLFIYTIAPKLLVHSQCSHL